MYQQTDGGRALAGFSGKKDCAIRAVSIACEMSYKSARKLLQGYAREGRQGNGQISRGVYKEDMNTMLESLGWTWHSAPVFEGRKARYTDIPGRAIVRMAKHYAAVINGILYDDFDSSNKMIYGYWAK